MERLREMAKRPHPDFVELSPREEQTMSMADELIRLRELIGHPCNFRVDLKLGRVILEMPLDEFRRCRALLEEAREKKDPEKRWIVVYTMNGPDLWAGEYRSHEIVVSAYTSGDAVNKTQEQYPGAFVLTVKKAPNA
jgi:hypothetical protein